MEKEFKIDLDNDIEYAGNTDEEKRLNKELLQVVLELNSYQDRYDVMMSVSDIKKKIEEIKGLSFEEYLHEKVLGEYKGWIDALTWTLNGSETPDEKLAKLPKASKEQVAKVIENIHNRYKQLSIFDEEVQNE